MIFHGIEKRPCLCVFISIIIIYNLPHHAYARTYPIEFLFVGLKTFVYL